MDENPLLDPTLQREADIMRDSPKGCPEWQSAAGRFHTRYEELTKKSRKVDKEEKVGEPVDTAKGAKAEKKGK